MGGRLSENSAYKILVIEAGGSADGIQAVEVPLLMVQASPDKYWNWSAHFVVSLRLPSTHAMP